jgi:hypothetical protein
MSGCTGMNGVLDIPANLITLTMRNCDGITRLTSPPTSKLVTLDISDCDTIARFDPSPTLTNLRVENSGLTYLDLTGTNVSTLNIPPEMYAQLQYLKLTGSKVKVPGLLKYQIPSGAKWILY